MARVLVIDDDADVLQILSDMLVFGGHIAITQIGGLEAWDALRDQAFDVVVTDLGMPSLDGLSIARWLKRHRPGVPVIAVSGALADIQDLKGDSPFAAAIHKPLRRHALLATVESVLGSKIE
jgi:CheY-like chemotaxis protein